MCKGEIIMQHRATITLDQESYAFLMSAGQDNRSAFINHLLKEEQARQVEASMLLSNREEANDIEYQDELVDWDMALSDGI